jgi:hypothetical protein
MIHAASNLYCIVLYCSHFRVDLPYIESVHPVFGSMGPCSSQRHERQVAKHLSHCDHRHPMWQWQILKLRYRHDIGVERSDCCHSANKIVDDCHWERQRLSTDADRWSIVGCTFRQRCYRPPHETCDSRHSGNEPSRGTKEMPLGTGLVHINSCLGEETMSW